MEVRIACILEDHGEREAVAVIIRRVAAQLDPALAVYIPPPLRLPKSRLLKTGELERAVELSARRLAGQGAILLLLDSDDDCPAQLGPELFQRATVARSDIPLAVVIAKREFEAWFLAAAESLRGHRGLPHDLDPPADPEAIRGAKEWLGNRMQSGHRYVASLDQPALAARFDLETARRTDSFDKCYREIARLLSELNRS
jgi:hypothetical protein